MIHEHVYSFDRQTSFIELFVYEFPRMIFRVGLTHVYVIQYINMLNPMAKWFSISICGLPWLSDSVYQYVKPHG